MHGLSTASKQALLDWYHASRRDLPWRRTSDPYAIWVSEVMLQQTQVATVTGYWNRWMAKFPTVEALAAADEQDVLSAWQGLGYYRRCRQLMQGAKQVNELGLPASAKEWTDVPGVGRYTAAAIASIAQSEPAPLVDGNVERVYARLAGDDAPRPKLTSNAWRWAEAHIPNSAPGDWNQALMELGATLCRPENPECTRCPLRIDCIASQRGTAHQLPTPTPSPPTVQLRQVVWIPVCCGLYGVRQIPEGVWWHGMWEFPRVDEAEADSLRDIVGTGEVERIGAIRHSVTRHRITLDIWLANCPTPSPTLKWCDEQGLSQLPMPSPQRKALAMLRKFACGSRAPTRGSAPYPSGG